MFLREIPPLKLESRTPLKKTPKNYSLKKTRIMRYIAKEHSEQPHILKLSGGRSSAMLLVTLLHNKQLDAKRGDVVIFNNTSAEHPATYDFVRKCKEIAENDGIPFFWTEFQTYEDVGRTGWNRFPSYKLVNSERRSKKNPDGYDDTGKVFEEMLAWKGYVPNIHSRVCTETMKIFVTSEFLRDWFTGKSTLDEQGHDAGEHFVSEEFFCRNHRLNGGSTPNEILVKKKEFFNKCPTFRYGQKLSEFTNVDLSHHSEIFSNTATKGGRAMLSGDLAIDYVSLIGFRSDEKPRIARMHDRNRNNGDSKSNGMGSSEGEYLYAPLESLLANRKNVIDFWNNQKFNLELPDDVNFSNCMFCFLKGRKELNRINKARARHDKELKKRELKHLVTRANTPSRINWWEDMEKKYRRDLVAEKRKTSGNGNGQVIGFFGLTNKAISFGDVRNAPKNGKGVSEQIDLMSRECHCND